MHHKFNYGILHGCFDVLITHIQQFKLSYALLLTIIEVHMTVLYCIWRNSYNIRTNRVQNLLGITMTA